MMKEPLLIGITGGIGSGKSVVSKVLKHYAVPIYDSDREAKRLMNDDSQIRTQLTLLFGRELYRNNTLNRKLLADLIFHDTQKLQQVNSLVHPIVTRDFIAWAHRQNAPVAAIESAILFEAGLDKTVSFTIQVTAPLEERIKRVMIRDYANREAVIARIQNQMDDTKQAELADIVIQNDAHHSLLLQVENLMTVLAKK